MGLFRSQKTFLISLISNYIEIYMEIWTLSWKSLKIEIYGMPFYAPFAESTY